nr:lytic murein transglycosylase [Ketogulonicigenium robustum]
MRMRKTALAVLLGVLAAGPAAALTCGNDAAGFGAWKREFASYAAQNGVGARGLAALEGANYATRTINADRNQRSFRYALDEFMRIRGGDTIVAQGRRQIANNRDFFLALEQRFGVPSSIIVAIHGMETGFGHGMGDSNVISAITTLAYDCRRPAFFTPHAVAALQLVDRGAISANSVGAMHGELGHTQFLPGNIITYGVDGNGDGVVDMTNRADALYSTANFLRQKGWQTTLGYMEGQPNFAVIQEWNAAGVYQRAIALIASRIDAP